jgi:Cd2+/Zn2+-exporting ATPase
MPCIGTTATEHMETQTLDIPVLWPNYFEDCEQCVKRLVEALGCLDGMLSVHVHPDRRTVEVSYVKDLLTFETIRQAARDLGVTLAERFKHDKVELVGLDCPDCAAKIEKAIGRVPGVSWVSANFATSMLVVEYEPSLVNLDVIAKKVRQLGYEVVLPGREQAWPSRAVAEVLSKNIRLLLTAASGAFLIGGLLAQFVAGRADVGNFILISSALLSSVIPIRSAYYSVRARTLDTNFLVVVAAAGAIWLGDYLEAATVLFLFSLGSLLEALSADKARRSIKSLLEEFPESVLVIRNGQTQQVPLADVEVGETVLIRPGDKIPVDGTIVAGESTVSEAAITGEPTPKTKTKGDTVYAGSLNGDGALEVRTSCRVEENTVSKIIHLVEEAQAQKATSQHFSETVGRYYTPVVITIAAIVALVGGVAFPYAYGVWLKKALTLLVVACPCALVVSVPVAVVCAIGNAAKSGVLIKGGVHLEALAQISVVAFDKTGTLTEGKLNVCEIAVFGEYTAVDVVAAAAAVESRSGHPLANAIIDYAKSIGVREMHVSFFEALPGKGARAIADGEVYYVGNKRLMTELGFDPPEDNLFVTGDSKPHTVAYVANERGIIGAIAFADSVRPTAKATIAELKSCGVRKTVLLTGDTADAARAVAHCLGIDEVYAELLPEQKAKLIRQLSSSRSEKVAMVGDGINDAPALAAAHVGIAMGGLGSQSAIEVADVTLMADDIFMLPYTLRLGRRARSVIVQNIVFSIGIATLLIIGALSQHVSLVGGVLGHEGSALLVIANGIRLLRRKR